MKLWVIKVFSFAVLLLLAAAVVLWQRSGNHVVLYRYAEECLKTAVAAASVGCGVYIGAQLIQKKK